MKQHYKEPLLQASHRHGCHCPQSLASFDCDMFIELSEAEATVKNEAMIRDLTPIKALSKGFSSILALLKGFASISALLKGSVSTELLLKVVASQHCSKGLRLSKHC